MKTYLLSRFQEPSSWRGVVLFITAIGIPVNPELTNHIVATGLAITGLIGFLTRDSK